ncbi:MAG: hypothetical protein NZ661_12170, partial [Candidatus Kapabacteria bacterium]|nr:hypothetical protein [Candidatus Kapabacteria bacterium]
MTLIPRYILVACALCAMLYTVGCSAFVQGIRSPIDLISDEALNDASHMDFLLRGVQAQFADTYTDMVLYSGGLSDELLFDARTGAGGLVIFEEVDNALIIDRSNTTLINVQNRLGRYRFHADDLVRRAQSITFLSDSARRRLLFHAYFHSAIARYFYASYIGINKQQGGGTIDNGPFIPSSALYDSALARLRIALTYAPSPYETRLTHTLIARIQVLQERFADCLQAAQNGLRRGDVPMQALYSPQMLNQVWNNAGLGRNVYVPARRYDTLYLRQEPTDTARIKLRGPITRSGFTFFIQTKYPTQDSPIPFLTWQENELLLAEMEVRLQSNTSSALNRINTVRSSYPGLRLLPANTLVTRDVLY